jgi:hypothetical protein
MTTFDASLDYQSACAVPLVKPRAKEYAAFDTREGGRKSRSSFLRFLLLNIILWPVLVFVGLQISASHSPGAVKLLMTSTGVQSMTADQLVATVKNQGRSVFWLNPISDDTYSDTTVTSGVDMISYRPEGTVSQNVDQSDLVIKTYRDSASYDARFHHVEESALLSVETLRGIKISYNPSDLHHVVIYFNNRPQVVLIEYPNIQKVSTLINDAQNLVLIN